MALTASGVAGFLPRHQIQSTMQIGMIDKTYQPTEVEGRIYAAWEQAGAFRAGRPERARRAPYSIVIPPPNVTGSLHMGHALNNTLQDILAGSSACAARTCCGSPAPTTPASPPRWWSSGS